MDRTTKAFLERTIYPHPPIVEAVIDLRFDSAISSEDLADILAAKLDSSYPSQSAEGDLPTLEADPPNASRWLEEIYSHIAHSRVDPAMDLLFHRVDVLFTDGRFDLCDDLLRTIDINRLDTNLLVGVLSVTLCADDQLRERNRFVQRVAARLNQLVPERAERLLHGTAGVGWGWGGGLPYAGQSLAESPVPLLILRLPPGG